jgi:hypothetical protein
MNLKSMHQFLSRWNKKGALQREALASLEQDFGFPPAMNKLILRQLFSKATLKALCHLKERRMGSLYSSDVQETGFVFPSNVPDAMVVGTIEGLLKGRSLLIKLSGRAHRFGDLFDPSLKHRLTVTRSREEFLNLSGRCQSVAAFGNDVSMKELQHQLPLDIHFSGFGHRLSAGLIFKGALKSQNIQQTVKDCAWDVVFYDQRGCLSPRFFLVQGDAHRFAEYLNAELQTLNRSIGKFRRSASLLFDRSIFLDRLRAFAASRPHWLKLHSDDEKIPNQIVYVWRKGPLPASPEGQVVGVKSFENPKEIRAELKPYWRVMASVGVAGKKSEMNAVKKLLKSSSVQRVCPVGYMQKGSWEDSHGF